MNTKEQDLLEKLKIELENELLNGILPYWINNTVDEQNGGFYGRITFDNQPVKDAVKGSVLNARILWTFSACYKKFGKPEYKSIADRAYRQLNQTFWDREYGGVFWLVDAKGNPTDSRKHVYAQAFVIYALSEYYGAFAKDSALSLAKELYHLLEEKSTDTINNGYFEAFTYNWQLMDDVRLSEKDRNEPKSMNTHLHVLEAYTNLYRYWTSPVLEKSLSHLLDIFADHIVRKGQTSLHTFLTEDWTPKSEEISFGHDIETSWLLMEAAEILGDYSRKKQIQQISLNLTNAVIKKGVDSKFGGIFNESGPDGLTDNNKDWWAQAEGIVGFLNAFQLSGNTAYLAAANQVWEFIKQFLIDKRHGEWHEKVTRSGVPYHLDKVREWKCPYHNSRAALEVLNRTELLADSQTNSNR